MNGKVVHEIGCGLWRHKGLLVIVLVPVVCVAFLVVEHLRGSILLARYIRTLSAQGEKMTARDFMSPLPPGENGAPEVLEAAGGLNTGPVLRYDYPPRMTLTPAGHAVIGFREAQWVDGKVTNHREPLAADLEANKATLERIRAAMASPVPRPTAWVYRAPKPPSPERGAIITFVSPPCHRQSRPLPKASTHRELSLGLPLSLFFLTKPDIQT